ncbi:hypothetical protein [Rivularia sp. UHCC 0363]|uniref:hypothetical protein n=1 Tax=Rivularia sp. UHCC 0363 TaxID=3110244 RepID=UPI002B1F0BC7|nr:hypothetical protein [Rivularia sp. UHCC 0363]MEA5593327.1 hypothetical protein [Rivularia sp. UHCC 0363]
MQVTDSEGNSRSQAQPGNVLREALPPVYKEGRAFIDAFPARDWEQGMRSQPETGNKEEPETGNKERKEVNQSRSLRLLSPDGHASLAMTLCN